MGDVEAKIVVLGSQGKTSLVLRYTKNVYATSAIPSTVGASFLTKRVVDDETGTTVRLQIWDTAGQERFRSMSRLYYRGANAGLLCYDITNAQSFEDMTQWLMELKENLDEDAVLHVVGTKSDLVQRDPSLRKVSFDTVINFVEEQLGTRLRSPSGSGAGSRTPSAKRSSGLWGSDVSSDMCHEISAKDGEGVEEVFRVITRKLVEQKAARDTREAIAAAMTSSRANDVASGHGREFDNRGSFRVGRNRRSWMVFPPNLSADNPSNGGDDPDVAHRRRPRCC
ncbi:MAG: hypothetical protein M1815_005818 [Lichina confinis]|nr:MAG: hypothetical protein M1815_005818 [Lichina confinis]